MSNLNFSDQTLTFNSEYDTHYLQARAISKIVNGEQVGSNYIYSQIVTLYTVERKPYVLRDLATGDLYGQNQATLTSNCYRKLLNCWKSFKMLISSL